MAGRSLSLIFVLMFLFSAMVPAEVAPEAVASSAPAEKSPLYEGDAARAHHVISLSLSAYGNLRSYQADFEREMFKDGKPVKSEKIYMRFEKPFVIFMKWLSGRSMGQQIVYSKDDFDGKLLTRPPGFFFLFIPIVHLAPDDPRLMKEEKQPIQNAGVGYFLGKFSSDFEEAAAAGQLEVLSVRLDSLRGEEVTWLRVRFNTPGREYPVVSVAFSQNSRMPLEIRLFTEGNVLSRAYRYGNFTFNPPRDHNAFRSGIDGRLWDMYKQIPERS